MGVLKIFFCQKIPDLPFQFIGCQTLHPQDSEEGQADIALGADADALVQFIFLKDRDLKEVNQARLL